MAPSLNKDDINLLKGVFATKIDLSAMEKRQDQKFVTKTDLGGLWQKVERKFEQLEGILVKSFQETEGRLQLLEKEVGIPSHN
ncbi:hypothetical protein A2634_04375 [Candidatus Amesbacteria bacterium RIFCSPHIGHO2_01_FULL_48_32]|uniref:Uncharacterized protein n=1 Tax=Candidatus Amesbacteria bacterium RIFCSPLOWO2_01_FULL_48_25 TaxID=1797259 RepID=A0A1F4ZCW7_9BACT|nr:MAG: hypothetical protein A2634_04375 [Candidatus Amesbacteria bacterium RIFCSPHIGHO2_01_FULL_48_32]OGD03786.1 MAG: hypothetical protein A2989_03840 [Candidatus Amesbacteria bacterium RIFCSPLOWO2_01_FULL_48_25]HJZ05107.1 hypothetical protein [Patescibacteria group bacterium]